MRLPNADHAIVDESKIRAYLLSLEHPKGATKAKFLLRWGFSTENPGELANALREHSRAGEVLTTRAMEFGTMYVVSGTLGTPRGPVERYSTVWIVESGEANPRLVTAYPG